MSLVMPVFTMRELEFVASLKERWTKLNAALLTRTTYQDETVESGKKYYYYLTAIDSAGNVSQPSEVVSETAP